MLTLGKHAAHAVREGLRSWAREDMAWEGVEVHDYAPVSTHLPSSGLVSEVLELEFKS